MWQRENLSGNSENPPAAMSDFKEELWRSWTHCPLHSYPPLPLPLKLGSGNLAGEANAFLRELEGCGSGPDNWGSPCGGEPLGQQMALKLKEWGSPCCV